MTTGQQQINVTPLIDVLLVLLIIFMVITPTQSMGLDANVPQPDPLARPAPRTIVVQLDSELRLRINSEDSSFEALGDRLREIFSTRAERAIFVKAPPETEFQHVARVMDIAKGAGIDQIGLLAAGN